MHNIKKYTRSQCSELIKAIVASKLPNASRVVQERLFEAFGNLEAKNITFSIFMVYNLKFEIIQILDETITT